MGKHEPAEGRWIPDKGKGKASSGFQVLGAATLRLLGKVTGWDPPSSDGPRTDRAKR